MENTIDAKGHCLCGSVTITAKAMSREVGACHCRVCRRWTGGPLLAVDCGSEVAFEGSEHIRVYNSSEWAERGFCGLCGSHLFYRLKANQQHFIPIGLFDDDAGVHFDHQVFIDEKPVYYSFANETRNMTGAEVFAAFGESPDG